MKKQRLLPCWRGSVSAIMLIVALLMSTPTMAQVDLVGKNMVGVRLGPWLAEGLTTDIETQYVRVMSSSTAFHLEMFYLYNLKGPLYLDINFGGVSRGDIRINYQTQTEYESGFGTALVYPLGVGLGYFPLATRVDQAIQPFITAGGSLVIGTETISTSGYSPYLGNFIGIQSESREALGWYAGTGFDWVLGRSFALSFIGKYQYAKFGKELVGVKDFSGVQILVGAAYTYQ